MKAPTTLTALFLTVTVTVSSAPTRPGHEEAPGVATQVEVEDHLHGAQAAELTEWQVMAEHQRRDRPGVYGADADMVAKVRRDMDKFAAAGLVLPPLRVYVHDSNEGCKNHDGLFNGDGSGDRIDLCHELVLLHELAHAWEGHTMDDATRQAFMDRTDVGVWNDHNVDHHRRGIEQAADVIATGVRAEQLRLDNVDLYRDHLELYELLTGHPSPRVNDLLAAHGVDSRLDLPADTETRTPAVAQVEVSTPARGRR